MKNWLKIGLSAIALLLAPSVLGEEGAPAGYQTCAHCHGQEAQGNPMTAAPALAGQDRAYLERQLTHFVIGVRGAHPEDTLGAQMSAMVKTLDAKAISELAGYLAELPTPVIAPAEGADLKNGNNYYQANCGACHGGDAGGNSGLNAPALAGLDALYIKRQMANFQNGLRGTHEEDKYGRQMKMMAGTLPDEKALDDVVAFIHSLGAVQ